MRILMLSLVALTVVTTPATAKVYALKFEPVGGQVARYDRDTLSIDSLRPSAVVRIVEVSGADKKSVSFRVIVLNTTKQAFAFGPSNVIVRPSGMQSLSVVTYDQMMQEERKQRKRDSFRAGLAAFGRSLDANSAGSEEGSGTYHGTNGWGSFSYSGNNAAAEAIARHDADMETQQDRRNIDAKWAEREASRSIVLRNSTVNPGTLYGGVATFGLTDEMRKKGGPIPITIEVDIGTEQHLFSGRLLATD